MKKIFKIIFYFLLSAAALTAAALLFLRYEYWEGASATREKLFSLENSDGTEKLKIRQPEKEMIKAFFKKIKNLIYYEATVHNPSGDMLPDQIDDKIIKGVKEKVE